MVRILMQNSLDPGDKMKLFLCHGYFDRNLSDSQYDPREDIKRIIVVLSAKTRSRLKAMGFFLYQRQNFLLHVHSSASGAATPVEWWQTSVTVTSLKTSKVCSLRK